jgi:hypothetical protein
VGIYPIDVMSRYNPVTENTWGRFILPPGPL